VKIRRHDVGSQIREERSMRMKRISFEIPAGVLAGLHWDEDHFSRELRLAAAVKWYEQGKISQGRGAEIAGISRAGFFDALSRFGVSPFQADSEELIREIMDE
jgi:predicted HTH domain antitoxin